MSSSINAITVVLENDISEEYCDELIDAICKFKGVLSASANVRDPGSWVLEERTRIRLINKLYDVLRSDK